MFIRTAWISSISDLQNKNIKYLIFDFGIKKAKNEKRILKTTTTLTQSAPPKESYL